MRKLPNSKDVLYHVGRILQDARVTKVPIVDWELAALRSVDSSISAYGEHISKVESFVRTRGEVTLLVGEQVFRITVHNVTARDGRTLPEEVT